MPIRVLHTSDWHLGHVLHRRRRDEEFQDFLDWLLAVILKYEVEVLVIAGDIFDTAMPSNAAQTMYYNFISRLDRSCCRHVIIIAGNHDSPAFLCAPMELLKSYQTHICGQAQSDDEVLLLRNQSGNPEVIVAAVPYLRERDVRDFQPGESNEERGKAYLEGMRTYYGRIARICQQYKNEYPDIPVMALGHLYASGAQANPDGGERDLYIGSLYRIPADIFPPVFEYVALGHIHKAQMVGGQKRIRYSGSPLPMSFREAQYEKSVTLVEFAGNGPNITEIGVPKFRDMRIIGGSRVEIMEEMEGLVNGALPAKEVWVEIQHDGSDSAADLTHALQLAIEKKPVDILCVTTEEQENMFNVERSSKRLEDYTPEDIFRFCLDNEESKRSPEAREELMQTFRELYSHYLAMAREKD